MDRSTFNPLTLTCVSALIAGFIPAVANGQEALQTIERAPENIFENERDATLAKFLEAGPINIRPHLYAESYFDDNLTLDRSNKREDWVWRIAPGAMFGVGEFRGDKGNYISIDYTLRGEIYTKYHEFNAVDHYVVMNSGWKMAKLTLGLSQSYEIDHGKSVEVGDIIQQEQYLTLLTSKYEISDKTSIELNGRQSLVYSDNEEGPPPHDISDINEWALESWGNYKATEKVTAGAGITVGWRDIRTFDGNPSPNQTYEQFLLRGIYQVSAKVNVTGSGGIQVSQFQDGDDKGPDFVFNVGASYRPLENTYLALEAYRHDVPSILYSGRNYALTGFRVSAKQIFMEKYSFSVYTGYENSDYTDVSTASAANPDRSDNYFWFRPVADYTVNERWQLGVFYQYRTKSSDDDIFDYSNNQVGLFSNYRF